MRQVTIILEQQAEGWLAYPLGVAGVVVAEANSREGALAEVASAIRFHAETFGEAVFDDVDPAVDGLNRGGG